MVNALRNYLRVLTTPACWCTVGHFSKKWDAKLQTMLGKEPFTNIGEYEARIGGYTVWIRNHPYASFSFRGMIPKRITMLRAMEVLKEQMIDDALKKQFDGTNSETVAN